MWFILNIFPYGFRSCRSDLQAAKKELANERLASSSAVHDQSVFQEKEHRLFKEIAIHKVLPLLCFDRGIRVRIVVCVLKAY